METTSRIKLKMDKENVPSSKDSVIDPSWEYIDPTPDIFAMFFQFNARFFWGQLGSVEVQWSTRMKACAGACIYDDDTGLCSVRLSAPLLKLRPRKDLVETLLHEMIHAYLFVTNNDDGGKEHGKDYHKHMKRINREAGTKITVHHDFHDEVEFYQQHWWRCDGPCQKQPPYFGMVRRAVNCTPGPSDSWWIRHKNTCGGNYTKVHEPHNYGGKKLRNKDCTKGYSKGNIHTFMASNGSNIVHGNYSKNVISTRNTTSSFHHFNTRGNFMTKQGMENKYDKPLKTDTVSIRKRLHSDVGSVQVKFEQKKWNEMYGNAIKDCRVLRSIDNTTLEGNPCELSLHTTRDISTKDICSGSSFNLDQPLRFRNGKMGSVAITSNNRSNSDSMTKNQDTYCPSCNTLIIKSDLMSHLRYCLQPVFQEPFSIQCLETASNRDAVEHVCVDEEDDVFTDTENVHIHFNIINCPVCNKELDKKQLELHLESCLQCVVIDDTVLAEGNVQDYPNCESNMDESEYPCPCCMTIIKESVMNKHLDVCLQ